MRNNSRCSKPQIQFSGFTNSAIIEDLTSKVNRIGGSVILSQYLDPHCTHLVCARILRSEKCLCALAAGKIIVPAQYIHDSASKNQWLDPHDYETKFHDIHQSNAISKCSYTAPSRCRKIVEASSKGMFSNWLVLLHIEDSKIKAVFKRILISGGARLVQVKIPIIGVPHLTHAFVDENTFETVKVLRNHGIPCVTIDYIRSYLMVDPPPNIENFAIDTYSSLNNSQILQTSILNGVENENRDSKSKSRKRKSDENSSSINDISTKYVKKNSKVNNSFSKNCDMLKSVSPLSNKNIISVTAKINKSPKKTKISKKLISPSIGQTKLDGFFKQKTQPTLERAEADSTSGDIEIIYENKQSPKPFVQQFFNTEKSPVKNAVFTLDSPVKDTKKVLKTPSKISSPGQKSILKFMSPKKLLFQSLSQPSSPSKPVNITDDTLPDLLMKTEPCNGRVEKVQYIKLVDVDMDGAIDLPKKFRDVRLNSVVETRKEPQYVELSASLIIIFKTCYDERNYVGAIDFLSSLLSDRSYPPATCLHLILFKILKSSKNWYLTNKANKYIHNVLRLFPPSSSSFRPYYLKVLCDTNIFELLHDTIEGAINFYKSDAVHIVCGCHLVLSFITKVITCDLQDKTAKDCTQLVASIFWPNSTSCHFNNNCRRFIKLITACANCCAETALNYRFHHMILMELCHVLKAVYEYQSCAEKETQCGFAREFASVIGGIITDKEVLKTLLRFIKPTSLASKIAECLQGESQRHLVLNNTPSTGLHSSTQEEASKVAASGPLSPKKLKKLNKKNSLGETQLMKACIKNDVEKVKDLLATPGIDVNVQDHAGWTALHEACNHGHVECATLLLNFKGIDVCMKGTNGYTALHDAVLCNQLQCVQALLKYARDKLVDIKSDDGSKAVDYAKSDRIRQLLLSA